MLKIIYSICFILIGLFIGAYFSSSILSMFDGIDEISDYENNNQFKELTITPSEASFIVVNLYEKMHWGNCKANKIYTDGKYYYVYSSWINNTILNNSYETKKFGYKVDGYSGNIIDNQFDDISSNCGFITEEYNYVKKDLLSRSGRAYLIKKYGPPFEINSSANIEFLHYYVKNFGEVIIQMNQKGNIINVNKANHTRI